MDQVRAVVPLALYLALFQILILRQLVDDSWLITGGLFAVIVGLMLFMEGLKLGLMPFGELIGHTLPRKSPLPLVLFITLLLGIGVTFAEPAIGALKAAGQNVSPERAPYLWVLLNQWTGALVLVIGASVGLAAVLGTLRFLYGWSLKPLIYASLVPVLGLTLYGATDPELAKVLGLAWDAGAVTTGPVTVPLVLSLGIGIAAAAGKGDSGLSGFGIVTLASLFPILGVLLLALYVAATLTPAEIIAAAAAAAGTGSAALAWYERSPGVEVILGLRAILPLVLFLFLILKLVLKETLPRPREIWLGIGLTVLGMCIFNLGLTYGLSKLGGSAGSLVPAAFMEVPAADGSPLYRYGVGLILALVFAWVLGFGATIAEPALNALGVTAEQLTNGFFKKRMLILAVSVGVACGIALGLTKLIFDLPLVWLIVPPYLIAAPADRRVVGGVRERRLGQRRGHHGSHHGAAGARHGDRVRQRDPGRRGVRHPLPGLHRPHHQRAADGPVGTGEGRAAGAGGQCRAHDRSSAGGPITAMKADKITYLTDVALITCIVSAGRGDAVIQAAQAMGAVGCPGLPRPGHRSAGTARAARHRDRGGEGCRQHPGRHRLPGRGLRGGVPCRGAQQPRRRAGLYHADREDGDLHPPRDPRADPGPRGPGMSAGAADAEAPAPSRQVGSRSAKLISCILPDDGTERRLLRWLRDQGITRANSVYCRGHSVLREAKARRGKLPEPELVRLVTIVVDADEADALFDRIYAQADIHRPGGGAPDHDAADLRHALRAAGGGRR